jgi:hypothetical protein
MTISMTTSQLTGSVDPLTELPGVGGAVSLVHGLMTDLGIPLWMVETVELASLLVVTFVVLRQLICRALPWLATVSVPAVEWLFERVAMFLLIPELAVTRVRARAGKAPLAGAYSYGEGVVAGVGAIASVVRVVLSALPRLRHASKAVPVVMTVLLALAWNHGTCALSPTANVCVSPATHWLTEVDRWFTEQIS